MKNIPKILAVGILFFQVYMFHFVFGLWSILDYQILLILLWYVSPTSVLLYFLCKSDLNKKEIPTTAITFFVIIANTYIARHAVNEDLSGLPFIFQPVQNWLVLGLHLIVCQALKNKIKKKYNQKVN